MICGPRKRKSNRLSVDQRRAETAAGFAVLSSSTDCYAVCPENLVPCSILHVSAIRVASRMASTLMFVSFTACTTLDGKIYNQDQIDISTIKFFSTSELR